MSHWLVVQDHEDGSRDHPPGAPPLAFARELAIRISENLPFDVLIRVGRDLEQRNHRAFEDAV